MGKYSVDVKQCESKLEAYVDCRDVFAGVGVFMCALV